MRSRMQRLLFAAAAAAATVAVVVAAGGIHSDGRYGGVVGLAAFCSTKPPTDGGSFPQGRSSPSVSS